VIAKRIRNITREGKTEYGNRKGVKKEKDWLVFTVTRRLGRWRENEVIV
jgi:hypothetical protein